jgi:hypothetical protein
MQGAPTLPRPMKPLKRSHVLLTPGRKARFLSVTAASSRAPRVANAGVGLSMVIAPRRRKVGYRFGGLRVSGIATLDRTGSRGTLGWSRIHTRAQQLVVSVTQSNRIAPDISACVR